jgi:hypothetical protein
MYEVLRSFGHEMAAGSLRMESAEELLYAARKRSDIGYYFLAAGDELFAP